MEKTDAAISAVRQLSRSMRELRSGVSLVASADFSNAQASIAAGTTTLHALIRRFNGPTASLEEVAREFFALGKKKAYEFALLNRLPLPTFRATDSNKAPLLVHVEDLAALIDARRLKARSEWNHSQRGSP